MKKNLVAILALIIVVGCTGFAAAATDVPANHWAYSAVKKLAADGILDSDAQARFNGDETLTRYEFAVAVAKAITKEDKATAEQKALINRLATEYQAELETLGVRINSLEEKTSTVQLSGVNRIRDDQQSNGSKYDDIHFNINFTITYKIDDAWIVKTEGEWQRQLDRPGDGDSAGMNALTDKSSWGVNSAVNSQMEQLYVAGPVMGVNVKIGKYSYKPVYGLAFDTKITGGEAAVGHMVKTTLSTGRTDDNNKFNGLDFNWAAGKNANVKAGYQTTEIDGVKSRYSSVGVDAPVVNDLHFTAAETKSNKNTDNKAYFAQLQYKVANSEIVGSNDIFASYRKVKTNAVFYTDQDLEDRILDIDFKGIRVGFDYVPMKNTKLTVWLMNGKDATTGLTDIRVYRGQMEFYF
ncbi:MAG: S-layer protein [Firmicutes bacterium]|nr:S-layer protein [Bacillota bacterium]